MKEYMELYRDELLNNIIPFWMTYSKDSQFGGYLTSLDRSGTVYDTDKWIWLQGREVWAFATFYNKIEKRKEWLDMALHGAVFLEKFGKNEHGAYYFGLTRDGRPLVQAYNIFSDCFCAMGYGALASALPESGYAALAKATFEEILSRKDDPKGKFNKMIRATRPLKNFSLPMILCNLALELEHVLGTGFVDTLARSLADEILRDYFKPEYGCVLENVGPDGSFVDSFEGRLINPGHGIEAMWFLLDIGERLGDSGMISQCSKIILTTLEMSWDRTFGGIFYFMDVQAKPLLQLEYDQKLWWVHVEALVACAKAYRLTKDEKFKIWFDKIHEYTWDHFKDREHMEWFGYLNRQGAPLHTFKGGKWKGCFHIPRAFLKIWKTLEEGEK